MIDQLEKLKEERAPSIAEDKISVPAVLPPLQIVSKFERTEDKYLIPWDLYQFFLDQLQAHMQPSYLIPGTQYTFIESRYYDSSELRFFQDHFRKLPLRHKLRTRRYGPNGKWQTESPQLELKAKQEGISKKERFQIGDDELQILANGETLSLSASLIEMNREIDEKKLIKRITKVNRVIEEVVPRPMVAVRYMRRAFEEDGIRVTMDCSLRTEPLGSVTMDTINQICEGPSWGKMQRLRCKIQNDSHFLLEVKHSGTTLPWLDELIQSYELKNTGFSKYCYAIIGIINTFGDRAL